MKTPINAGETNTTEAYTYWPGGQPASVITTVGSTVARTVYYYYDSLNRLTNKYTPEGLLTYTWTPDNHVHSIQAYNASVAGTNGSHESGVSPDVSLGYSYDCLGRVASVTNSYLGPTTYGYDAVGNLAWTAASGGPCHTYSYNAQNRLVTLLVANDSGTVFRSYYYTLGLTGLRTNTFESNGAAFYRQVVDDYDHNYGSGPAPARVSRLTRETFTNNVVGASGAETNVYDAVGNRITYARGFGFTPQWPLANQTFAFEQTATNSRLWANFSYGGARHGFLEFAALQNEAGAPSHIFIPNASTHGPPTSSAVQVNLENFRRCSPPASDQPSKRRDLIRLWLPWNRSTGLGSRPFSASFWELACLSFWPFPPFSVCDPI